jgi:hypothetical protein
MSGHNYDSECPNCGGCMDCYTDHRPFDHTTGECLECGFYYGARTGQVKLKELNTRRKNLHMDPLNKRRATSLDPNLKW